jgi:uncharacterized BrkB/YihY/UPF0761 family membrane protein
MYTWATLKRTIREVRDDNLTDWAAALTYYSVLALFPGLIVLVAILGLVGQHPETTNALLDIVRDVGPASAVDTFRRRAPRRQPFVRDLVGLGLCRRLHTRDQRDL